MHQKAIIARTNIKIIMLSNSQEMKNPNVTKELVRAPFGISPWKFLPMKAGYSFIHKCAQTH